MAAEEHVVIHIDIEEDFARERAKMEAFFASLDKNAKTSSRSLDDLDRKTKTYGNALENVGRRADKTNRSMSKLWRTVKSVGGAFAKFFQTFGKFSFIASAIEIGLVAAALLSVKVALVGGRLAMRGYQAALSGLGVAAGGVAVGLSSVAAAMREISEVQLAPFTGGLRNAAMAMRNSFNDNQLSFFGIEGIQNAVTALAQGGVNPNQGYTSILKNLGNFTPDPKQLADLAKAYATVQQSGSVSSDVLSTLSGANPTLTAGLSELTGIATEDLGAAADAGKISAEVFNALFAGQARATDAFEGQLERMSNTVVGMLKGALPRIYQQFAAMGEPFLSSIKQVIFDMERIISGGIMRIRGTVSRFGLDAMLPGVITLFEKATDFMVRLINRSLPQVETWIAKIGDLWNRMRGWFRSIGETFSALEQGADILWEALKNALAPFFTGFGNLVKGLNSLLVRNEKAFLAFGTAFGNVITGFMEWFGGANSAFAESLPVWTNFLNVLATDGISILSDFFKIVHEGAMVALPAIASGISAIAPAITAVANAVSRLLSVPGIGQLLGMAMLPGFLGGGLARGAMGMAGKGIMGIGRSIASNGAPRVVASSAGLSMSARAGLALTAAGGVGGAGMIAAGSGLAGYGIGTYAGNRVGGAGGQALGFGGGAAAGAGIGAALGTIIPGAGTLVGAAVGGVIGGITGGVSAWMAQDRNKKAVLEQANLERLWRRQEQRKKRYESKVEDRTKALAEATGKTTDQITELADAMRVDLGNTAQTVTQQLHALGEIDLSNLDQQGIRDTSSEFVQTILFDDNSAFQRQFVQPQRKQNYGVAFSEMAALQGRGELIPPEMMKGALQDWLGYGAEKYGSQGMDLLKMLQLDAGRIETHYGLQAGTVSTIVDEATTRMAERLGQNDVKALEQMTRDNMTALLANADMTQSERDAGVQQAVDDMMLRLENGLMNDTANFDELLNTEILKAQEFELITAQETLIGVLDDLGIGIERIVQIMNDLPENLGGAPQSSDTPYGNPAWHQPSFGYTKNPSGSNLPYVPTGIGSSPGVMSTPAPSINNKVNAPINIQSAFGFTPEAQREVLAFVQRAMRLTNQRSSGSSTYGGNNNQYD